MGSEYKHNWLANKIYEHPNIIGENGDINAKCKEHALLYKGHLLTIPDIVFYIPEQNHYVEVKSGQNENLYSKGMSQLEKIMMWHEHNNFTAPNATLVMPRRRQDKLWIEMLEDLELYKPGDSYGLPSNY